MQAKIEFIKKPILKPRNLYMQANILKLIIFNLTLTPLYSLSESKNYPKPIDGYFSQRGQDKYLNETIFKEKKNGFFVDVGAHDGISFSNTYFFEKNLNWQGICIEPNPDIFQKLIKNRNATCLQIGIANISTTTEYLKCSGFMLEMYSGIIKNMDPRHRKRIEHEMIEFGGNTEIVNISVLRLCDIFETYQIKQIDLLSIDIEGGEEEAIKSIDFDKVKIDIIVIENNFNENKIKKYLLSCGYVYLKKLDKDDIFQLKKNNNS